MLLVNTETTKIELIRRAAVTLMSRQGVDATSISQIAKEAGVSVGYLYRHYESKEQLVEALLHSILTMVNDAISDFIDSAECTEDLVFKFNHYIYQKSVSEPPSVKFLIMQQNDFSQHISDTLNDQITSLCMKLVNKCSDDFLDENLTLTDIYVALVGVPFNYYSLYYKNMINTQLSDKIVEHIATQSLKLLCKR